MKRIEFSKEETRQLVGLLQVYFRDELDHEIGQLPAELLLDFIGAKIGVHFYNRGLYDAQAVLAAKVEDISEAIYGLERKDD
jgi:uncharacterized protein (DUF2164 family)